MTGMAERWLAFSDEDLRMAELALEDGLWNQVCFHSHQSAEKSLKSLIAGRGENTPRTHSLTDLMSLLGGRVRDDLEDDLRSLEGFYIPTRYPDAVPGSLPEGLPEEEDSRMAFAAARKVSRTIREISDGGSP